MNGKITLSNEERQEKTYKFNPHLKFKTTFFRCGFLVAFNFPLFKCIKCSFFFFFEFSVFVRVTMEKGMERKNMVEYKKKKNSAIQTIK